MIVISSPCLLEFGWFVLLSQISKSPPWPVSVSPVSCTSCENVFLFPLPSSMFLFLFLFPTLASCLPSSLGDPRYKREQCLPLIMFALHHWLAIKGEGISLYSPPWERSRPKRIAK
ncbi:hypothetical protein IE53DRAFT_226431 [Violaceomyces palustris]|uniref:Uncharacterized protein n=1 Tax=Violaceomyces palustris TaxID=1673888 RepID=A0ACD0P4U6_9BASI|nr:hypothetical protein IE53DRAFT_226431 [Violaceomyces palustris]